jgi:membrane protease YdiL (CAAX protease family)
MAPVMTDLLLSFSAHLAIVATLVVVLKLLGKITIHWQWVALSLALYIAYFAALITGIPLEPVFGPLDWNWGGKLLAILLWIVVLFATLIMKPGFILADAGFTFRQREGSATPSLVVMVAVLIFHLLLTYRLGGETYTTEELWFQALIPGLDEEPMFRGLLLYFLTLALVSVRISLFGASLNLAGLLLVFLFGLVHGLQFSDNIWSFSGLVFSITGLYGFVFLWIRERTGSLVLPILTHNAINLFGQLIPAQISG